MKDLKKFYFLCGLPRCGNTLLSSIMNQNKNITVTANSILPTLFQNIISVYHSNIFLNFPNYKPLDNVIKNLFSNYYSGFASNVIIDRGPWGTPFNLQLIKALKLNTKFILLTRPVLEILASFIKIENCKNIESRCDELMSEEGIVGKYYMSYQNLIKTENVLIINYNDLCFNTKSVIKKIYKFLNIKKFNHTFCNLKQLNIDNIGYDDSVCLGKYHSVRNEIKKINIDVNYYLTKSVINKYKHL